MLYIILKRIGNNFGRKEDVIPEKHDFCFELEINNFEKARKFFLRFGEKSTFWGKQGKSKFFIGKRFYPYNSSTWNFYSLIQLS